MRNLKYLFLGVLLLAFSAITSVNVNATNYVKDSDLTAETTVASGDTIIFYDTSAGNTLKTTIANIYASAANVGASTIVIVGALDAGSITANFGPIDNGTSNITSGGLWTIDVDGTNIGLVGSMSFGASSNDGGIYFDGTDFILSSTVDISYEAQGDDHIFSSSTVVVATIDDTGIDIVTNDFTTGGQYVIDVDGTAIAAAGSFTYGAGSDAGFFWDGTDAIISSTADQVYAATGADHIFKSNAANTIVATIDDTGIDIVTNDYTTGGQYIIDVDGTVVGAAGSITIGAGTADAGFLWDGTDFTLSSTTDMRYSADGDDHIFMSSNTTVATIDETGIDLVANGVRSGGIWRIDVDGTLPGAAGALGFGAGTDDSSMWWDGSDHILTSTGGIEFGVVSASDINFFEVLSETARIDFEDAVSSTALMLYSRADDSLIRVTVGANDTGGTGFRALHIPNL